MVQSHRPVWFIGRMLNGIRPCGPLARAVLRRGWPVVVTARDVGRVQDIAGGDARLPLALDVTEPDQVAAAVAAAQERFGAIDVARAQCRLRLSILHRRGS